MPDIAAARAAAPYRFDHAKLGRLRRAWLQEHDARPEEFALRVPVSMTYLRSLEAGRNAPNTRLLCNLAALLGVEPGDLLTTDAPDAAPAVAS